MPTATTKLWPLKMVPSMTKTVIVKPAKERSSSSFNFFRLASIKCSQVVLFSRP